jgi:uncharacterized membrane protein
MDLVKFLEKNQKLHIWIVMVTLKVTSCRTMSKKKVKKSENAILIISMKVGIIECIKTCQGI